MIALISESVAFGSELRAAPLPPDFNVGYEGITISWYCAKSGTPPSCWNKYCIYKIETATTTLLANTQH